MDQSGGKGIDWEDRCRVSGVRVKKLQMKKFLDVEDLVVYKKLCQLHIEVCQLTHQWPREELYELGSQVRRSSNSAPAQLAEKNDDRHIRNKIEGVNRGRGEAGETVHHLFMAKLKGYITEKTYMEFRNRYKECIRMLNGLEKTLEHKIPAKDRRWQIEEDQEVYNANNNLYAQGWPITPET
jgi:four helix bundle protein